MRGYKPVSSQRVQERLTTEGDSPVCGSDRSPLTCALQSSAELVELRAKRGGPPPKAKYSSMTDSGQVGRLNDEKHGDEPSQKHLKPCTYERSEHYASSNAGTCDGVPFA